MWTLSVRKALALQKEHNKFHSNTQVIKKAHSQQPTIFMQVICNRDTGVHSKSSSVVHERHRVCKDLWQTQVKNVIFSQNLLYTHWKAKHLIKRCKLGQKCYHSNIIVEKHFNTMTLSLSSHRWNFICYAHNNHETISKKIQCWSTIFDKTTN